MIRLSVFWVVVSAVAIYTWRDWFKGLCGLVLLMAILEMPDVPKTMFGIEGLNFFNVLLANLVIAWLIARHRENLKNDVPAHVIFFGLIYLAIILIGFYRLLEDHSYLNESRSGIIREYLINTLKWVLPGVMLYDGCRTRERTIMALLCVMFVYLFLGAMVIKVMPIRAVMLDSSELQRLAYRLLGNRIGYHRVTLSMMLAGASWAMLAMRGLTRDKRLHAFAILISFFVLYAQSLTGGRAGYVTWGLVGLVLCVLRWRGYMLVAPLMVALVLTFVPSVADRMFEGFTRDTFTSNITVNELDVTAGRVIIWSVVTEKIQHGWWVGFGRMGIWTTGIVAYVSTVLAEDFGHPHNAYLEWILDNGLIGFVPVMCFYLVMLFHACRLFCDRRSGIFMAAGGAAAALTLGLLGASIGSQSFYPVEGTVGMWCALGIMLRVSVNRTQALATLRARSGAAMGALSNRFAYDPGRAAAAAASLDALLWPTAEPIVPVGRNAGRSPRPAPTVRPDPVPGAAASFDGGRRLSQNPKPDARVPDPDASPRFVFENVVPARKSS